jgi:plasmid stabilization system protein ParE
MQVRFADAALTDIENIRTYISRDNPSAATRIAAAIVAAADRLSVNPRLGSLGAMPGAFELIVSPMFSYTRSIGPKSFYCASGTDGNGGRGLDRRVHADVAAEMPASLGPPLGPARPQRTFLAPTRRVKPLLGQILFKARSC